MITEATLRQIHLYPELLADAVFNNIAANTEIATPILELRRLPPLVAQLVNIGVEQDDDVEVRIKSDVVTTLPGVNAGSLLALGANPFDILAKERIRWNLFSSAVKANFRCHYGLWCYQPTVAHKLKFDMPLTPEEERLNKDLGISDTVEKGLLPLPLSHQIEREYQIITEETHARILTLGATSTTIQSMVPPPGEFLVLTKLACDPGVAGDNIRITIDRDDDPGYITDLRAFPLALTRDLDFFIPALSEIRITAIAAGAVAGWNVRYTVLRCKLNNIVRARWGLVTKDELPEPSLWDRVKGGVV